jgi:GT2 family glycosyltransferase
MKSKIAIICVNYESYDYTIKMCKSLKEQEGIDSLFELEVFVVDNSPYVSNILIEYCKSESMIRYLRSKKNDGYFSGLNFGLQAIQPENYDFVTICNNDLEFEKYFIKKLLRKSYKKDIFVICPNVVTVDGIYQNPHHLNPLSWMEILAFDLYFSNFWIAKGLKIIKGIFTYRQDNNIKNIVRARGDVFEINQGVGACYILTHAFFKKHDELFYPYFLYGEEALLSWQVRSSGGKLVFDSQLNIKHDESATLSTLPVKKGYNYGRQSYWQLRKYLSD